MRKLLAAALVCGVLPAYGWGPEGHNLVTRIAVAELTPAAQAKVREILGPDQTLVSISSWADQVRRQRANTGPWHYIDIPIDQPHMDMARDCPKDDCVVAQIAIQRALMVNPSATAEQRKEALMFVVHFVGDMHQPLHCSDNKDKGGNDVHVVLFDRPGNLHSTWDSGLLSRMGKEDDLFPAMLKEAQKRRKKWSKGSVADWAEESHKAAQKTVYGKLPPEPKGTPEPLGAAYEAAADPVIRVQIEKAGDRLARVLNDTLK
ncbi:MAG: S1/P1 nuclease [Candidatus Sulfopaludibacter sp.]|nr:S1/P1 nuclease [Candidatus Sulfopaludibacter sp.]